MSISVWKNAISQNTGNNTHFSLGCIQCQHTDIHLLFPPIARKLTLREQATEMMLEKEIRTQATKQQAAALWVQVLHEKFKAAASKRSLHAAREDSTAGHKQEVHWDGDPGASAPASLDLTMTEAEGPHSGQESAN